MLKSVLHHHITPLEWGDSAMYYVKTYKQNSFINALLPEL